jgi:hypothetical protein
MTARLLIIGLDGADGRTLDRGSVGGELPSLAALRARGRAGRLSAPPGSTDDALWASFHYGVGVGEHGRYHSHFPREDGRLVRAYWQEQDRPAFWDDLSDQGRRVAVLDVPKVRNPRPLNGIHLADWLAHGRYFPKPRSQPTALAAEVLARFGQAPPSRCGHRQPPLSDDDIGEIEGHLRAAAAMKRAAGLYYLAAEPWDLFLIGFKEAHCASHAFWDFDPGHPAHDPGRRARLGDPVMRVLRNLDDAVGELVAAAGPAAEVLVFSPTDFGPNGGLGHLGPAIVERLNARVQGGCAILPYNESCLALRVGDGGRLGEIERLLSALTDAETGRPAMSAITRPSADHAGSRTRLLPDLLLLCAPGAFPRAVTSPELGLIEADAPSMRPGNHIGGGFAVGAGSRVTKALGEVRTLADIGALARTVLCARERPASS